jgi:HAD superfamily phosphoserine phosphatase-like hydrolase
MTPTLPEPLCRIRLLDEPRLALFDADGTLWEGDIAEEHALWMIGTGRIHTGHLWPEYRRLLEVDFAESCRLMLRLYEGIPEGELARCASVFWREAMKLPFIEPAVEAVRALAQMGFKVWVVTGSPRQVLEPLRGLLPIERIVGMEFEVAGGALTGRSAGLTTAGDGKVQAVRALFEGDVQLAAGNSVSDAPMLRMARDVAWAVHPSPALESIARERGWFISPAPKPRPTSSWPTLEEELAVRGFVGRP